MSHHAIPEVVLTAKSRNSIAARLHELWQYRELLLIFSQREISVRYKQTAIGVAWTMLQPLISAAIFAVIFGMFAKFPSDDVPYVLFAFCGLSAWQYFSRSLTEGANTFVANSNMLSKVYFPRLLFGLIPVCYGLIDFALSFVALLIFCLFMHVIPQWTIIFVPLILVMGGLLAYGCGLILAPINAVYRDVSIALPFVVQIMMYVSPIVLSQSIVPQKYIWLVDFNPIATFVILMRWAVFGSALPTITASVFFVFSIIFTIVLGINMVAKAEETLVDRI